MHCNDNVYICSYDKSTFYRYEIIVFFLLVWHNYTTNVIKNTTNNNKNGAYETAIHIFHFHQTKQRIEI